ncbi:SDR family oxidoreductase [Streptomyces iranensis]
MTPFFLNDRAAVVTGAGRGIGAATAIALARAGADVLIASRTQEDLRAVAKEIESHGRRAVVVRADLSAPGTAGELAERAMDTFGRLDIVVNNVGDAEIEPFQETSWEAVEKALRYNVGTAHALTRAALPHLLAARDGGAVVNICSTVGRVAARGWLSYGMSKAALAHYTRLAAHDLAPRVRVNGVVPGAIATDNLRFVMEDDAARRELEAATPMRRAGTPEDVAHAVVYLASPAASYVTGTLLEVDGGIETTNVDLGIPDLEALPCPAGPGEEGI